MAKGLAAYIASGQGGQCQRSVGQNLAGIERDKIIRLSVDLMLKSRVQAHGGVLGTGEVSKKRDFKPYGPTCLGKASG